MWYSCPLRQGWGLPHRKILMSSQEHSQLLKALRESELLRELSELLASSLDPTHILQVLVRRTAEACDVERCAVWLLDASQAHLHPSAYHLSPQSVPSKFIQVTDRMWHHSSIPFENPTIHRLLENSGMLFLEDASEESSMRPIVEKLSLCSVLLVALVREDRPVGMMSLDNPSKTIVFTREQQQLARAIGQQAAVAIDNARLYQQAQSEWRRAEQLVEHSQSIYQVAMAVNSGEDLPQVLEIATQQLAQGTDALKAAITFSDKDVLTLANTIPAPLIPTKLDRCLAPSLSSLSHCQTAVTNETPIFVTKEQMSKIEQQWFQQLGMENVMIVPLILGVQDKRERKGAEQREQQPPQARRCIGFAFACYPRSACAPNQVKRTFARDIAAQCALAIEKARILSEAQQAVALATERANTLDAVFNAMTEGILVIDMQGQIILNNNTASRFMSLSPNVIQHLNTYLKHNPAYTFYGQSIQAEDFPLKRALEGECIRGERFISKRKDGSEYAVEVNIASLLDSQDEQIGIVSAFRDITEQAHAEQRIRRALDTMLHAAEKVSGISDIREILYRVLAMTLAALNCERGVVQLYSQETQIFQPLLSVGFSLEDVDPWLAEQKCWPSPEKCQDAGFYVRLLEGHASMVDMRQSRDQKQASSYPMVLAAPIMHSNCLLGVMLLDRTNTMKQQVQRYEQGATHSLPIFGFTAWDMAVVEGIGQFAGLAIEQTRWKQEAEIARTNEASMRESNELKDEFLAITAHEFRTPLTVILTSSQMMSRQLRKADSLTPELKARLDESLSSIEEQTHHLTNIVNTFLEVTRLNRGQIILAEEDIHLEEVVKETIAHHSSTLTNHTIHCHIEPSQQPYILKGDKTRLLQIFANLLQNAIKYSPFGGPIMVSMKQFINSEGKGMINVCIEDKGIGVPKDAQPYLFERFYRAPNIGGNQVRGIGLGLYLVAEFLSLHGGSIHVESDGIVGEGSRFIFTLPLLERELVSN
jgi:PAS domain S-box-containing protein